MDADGEPTDIDDQAAIDQNRHHVENANCHNITFKFSSNTGGVRACFHFVQSLTTLQGGKLSTCFKPHILF